jgi:hypothetical protein
MNAGKAIQQGVTLVKLSPSIILFLAVTVSLASDQSPYVGEEVRPIKSLSASEIESLRRGDGMGFAKLAELNHYPGPRHVLELVNELGLTSSQLSETESLFEEMRASASALGDELVEAEAALDRSFENNVIDARSLELALLDIGELRARIRYVHLEAHLQQKRILTAAQIAEYDKARGYSQTHDSHAEHSQHH